MCLISPISCWHVTRLSRYSVRLMNERRNLYHSQINVMGRPMRNLFVFWLLRHWKIRIAYRQWRSNFPRRGQKSKIRKEKLKVTYSVAFATAFLADENGNRQEEDLPQADFSCVRHSPLAPLGQVDEWTAKLSRFSIQVVCRNFLELWWLKH